MMNLPGAGQHALRRTDPARETIDAQPAQGLILRAPRHSLPPETP
ncbi:hypothetical protein [Acetobacter musti]|nr:hypothetical protein [Acetobacter musti]